MKTSARARYAGYRFPSEIISHAVWLYFRFPLGLSMVEELLAARGIIVSHETVRQWARKFGRPFANQIRRRLPRSGEKWHLDEVVLKIPGVQHWLWRAVDQTGIVLDVLVQRRRNKQAAKRLLRKLLKKQIRPPRVMITDKLASYGAAKREVMPGIEHRQHKGLNNRAEISHQPTRRRERNEAVQIGRPGAAVPLRPRSDQQPLPSPPRSYHCRRAQSIQDRKIPDLGRNLQCGLAIGFSIHCRSPKIQLTR
jgi:putative transposase